MRSLARFLYQALCQQFVQNGIGNMEQSAAANFAKTAKLDTNSANHFHPHLVNNHTTEECNKFKELIGHNGGRGRGNFRGRGDKGRGGGRSNNTAVENQDVDASDDHYLDASPSFAFALPDSGTTHDMFHNKDLCNSLNSLEKPINITFGNGQCLQATHTGTVQLNKSITRSNVPYVPGFAQQPHFNTSNT
jgi:hypothetical protein